MTGWRQAPRGRMARGLILGISLIGAARLAAAEEGVRSRWALQVSGFTHHFQGTHNRAHPSWNSVNTGIGLQYDIREDATTRWSTTMSVGEIKDSYGVVGPYAGIVRQYRLNDARIRARLGLGAFLAWRALDWTATRKLTFLPMPVLSVEDTRTGLGFNLTGTPSIRYDDRRIVSFVFIQGTYRF
ncbi:hypothetical protein [Noviherbaspirillum pedocola]|uniref:Uncharacterized protein n=1 Tax=Noviherbaspirillum pedocola TaxID=2801341 RepID=A0A934T0C5_9BURK|nr:hypothetical protein [Noviherbaspirillum pedocola]MBK4738351.1 hypothetical protein [Noviherbaspirillum pedocola]